MQKLSEKPRKRESAKEEAPARKLVTQGPWVIKSQAHTPPTVCGSGSAEKHAFHHMPRTCLQELPEKQKGGILDFRDTLTNKVILLKEREKRSSDQNTSHVTGLGRPTAQHGGLSEATPTRTCLLLALSLADGW